MKLLNFVLFAIAAALCPISPSLADEPLSAKTRQRISVEVTPRVLTPARGTNTTGQLVLRGFYADGSSDLIAHDQAVITAHTKVASGKVQVIRLDGAKVVPEEGGVATIEASLSDGGRTLTAATEVVVEPYFRDYHQTLVMKLFLGMEGEPVERLAKEPMFLKPHDVFHTFEEALDIMRKTDQVTRGMPKIIYLVGWQKGGHDHGYPDWSEVNPRLKRAQDATALDSLRWLIREGRKYHTTVSLHLNMVDAYQQSPLWDEYVAKDCFAKDENGKLLVGGIQMKGEDMYNVVYPKEWEAGLAQRRIDGLIRMIPELQEGHTIHIDVFIANRDGGKPISPWHLKPENGGLTPEKYVETQRQIFHYWRDRGFDITGEGTGWAHPPGEHFVGLQAMSWWYSWNPMEIPECLGARGRTTREGEGDFRFGESMHGETLWLAEGSSMPSFLGAFCRTALPWHYLSRLERKKVENDALFYSEGVVALTESGKRVIRQGDFVLREDDNLFVPARWKKKEIIAYSKLGYTNRAWQLPADWSMVKSVDLYGITLEGSVPVTKGLAVANGKLLLSLQEGEAVSIVPAGNE